MSEPQTSLRNFYTIGTTSRTVSPKDAVEPAQTSPGANLSEEARPKRAIAKRLHVHNNSR